MDNKVNSKIFDGFEHMGVYIVDRETMVIYYENAIAEKYSGRERIGEPCFKIHGNDTMCSSCPIRNKDHISLVNRSDYNMLFAVRAEEIIWDGHDAYFISVVKQSDYTSLSEEEKSINRMSRALQKSVSVYTEINMETNRYKQINFSDYKGFNIDLTGDYTPAFEYMCQNEIDPADVPELRHKMSLEAMKIISAESEGPQEVFAEYRLKGAVPERIMQARAIFLRDELPHYVVNLTKDVTEEYNLRKRANEYESILNHVSCGVAIYNMDTDGKITVEYANDGLARLAECSKDVLMQLLKQEYLFGVNEENRAVFNNALKKINDGEESVNTVFYATTYKNNGVWLNANLTASQKENGILQVYATYFDVTSDVKIQQEFKEKYEVEKRRSKDDTSILAYAVFDLFKDTTIEMERRAPFDKLEKKFSLDDFCEDIGHSIVSDDKRARFTQMFNATALLKKHAEGIDEQSIEYQRKLPDGKIIWVKSSFHVIADLTKNTIFLFYYCNDINLTKSLELMNSYIVDEDYDMIGSINFKDEDAIMLYGKNSSRRLLGGDGVHMEEKYTHALNWFIDNAIVPEEREQYRKDSSMQNLQARLNEKSSYERIVHVYDGDKNIRVKKLRYTRNSADENSCFFSQTDITDMLAEEEKKQQRLQAALESTKQANEAKTAFLSRMSHDMRTPMNGVLGLAALMRDETNLDAISKDIDQLEMSGKYLLQLINDTLDVSKIESGKMELRLKPIDSEVVFGNIFTNASMLAKDKGVRFDVNQPNIKHGEWVPVMADASRLEQVIMNIVSNAVKFTPKGGEVHVDMQNVSITDKEVVDKYTITDNGIGMSKEFLDHIYEPFAQEGRINTARESGTGLGMSIVKQLVELMHGSIEIKSEVGKGTQVTLVMRYPVCARQGDIKDDKQVDLSVLNGKTFLLCEDHPLNAQIAQRLLEKAGVTTVHAKNGKEGLDIFANSKQGEFDLILMDIRMPEMNGIEATKAIRALDRPDAKTIPIIAMTANAFDDDVTDCKNAGMNAHISKPIDPAVMYDTIAQSL